MLKNIIKVIALLSIFCSAAHAERPSTSNSQQYIVVLSQPGFDGAGTILIPLAIMKDAYEGRIDDLSLLVMGQHMLNTCAQNVMRKTPGRRTSYVNAKAVFEEGLCEMNKCYQSATLLTQLSLFGELSDTDPQAQAALVAQLSKTYGGSCADGTQVDPAMLNQAKQ